jgi:2,3-bisphosphoglycerate-independent phosphoglycerate mutase
VLDAHGLSSFRTAETEKYPHVTYFFNGGEEQPHEGEERRLVPSPKVPTYDHQPEMSAEGVTEGLLEAIRARRHDVLVCNYANPDMVGHTGVMEAAVRAVETVDACLGRVVEACRETGTVLLVTADHGNCEQMWDPDDERPPHGPHDQPGRHRALRPAGRGLRRGGPRRTAPSATWRPPSSDCSACRSPKEMTGRDLRTHAGRAG